MRPAAVVFLSALGLALLMALPVLRSPGERLIGREIVGRHHDAYTVISQFEQPRPLGHPLQQPATDLAGAAVARLTGGVVAYNVIVLMTFPLAALFAFWLARHFGLRPPSSAFAGLLFAFAPSHLAHAAYHPQIVQVQWIPLYFLALCRCLDRWTPLRAAALVAASGLLGLASFYLGFFAVLLTPVAILLYPARGSSGQTWRERLATAATLAGAGLAGALALRLSPARLTHLAATFGFPAADLERYSARWQSYLLPSVDHPLAGDAVTSFWRARGLADGLIEQQLTVGLATLALAAVALVAAVRWPPTESPLSRRHLILLATLAATAFLASLVIGPGPLLHRLVPLFRAYARFGIFAQLALAILAAAGLSVLTQRGPRERLAALLLLSVCVIEYAPFPPWRWHPVLPTEAHRWMARQSDEWRLLDCVSLPPLVAGSIFQFLPRPAAQLSASVPDCAEPDLPGKLAASGFSHLLLRSGSVEDLWFRRTAVPEGLVELATFADSRVLRIEAEPSAVLVQGWRGFSWREYGDGQTFRWLGPAGDWSLHVPGAKSLAVELEVELNAFPSARSVDLGVDGRVVATLAVGTEPAVYRVGPVVLRPGFNNFEWRPRGEAVIADDVLGNGDRRALSLAVGDWRWLRARQDPVDNHEDAR